MRYPLLNRFLVWSGAGLLASPVLLLGTFFEGAGVYPGLHQWGYSQYTDWWPIMTAWWFIGAFLLFLIAFIGAIVYTGGNKEDRMKSEKPFGDVRPPTKHSPTHDTLPTVTNCVAVNCGGDGLNAKGGVHVRGFTAIGNGGDGVRIGRGVNAEISDVTARDNKGAGLNIEGDPNDKPELALRQPSKGDDRP